jgi:hypothetical protein
MKTLINFINESLDTVNESISKDEIENIANAVISVFSNWENDESGWDPRFNAYKEVHNSSWEDILEYYQGWEDLYEELDMTEDEFDKLCNKMSASDWKKIHKLVKDAF